MQSACHLGGTVAQQTVAVIDILRKWQEQEEWVDGDNTSLGWLRWLPGFQDITWGLRNTCFVSRGKWMFSKPSISHFYTLLYEVCQVISTGSVKSDFYNLSNYRDRDSVQIYYCMRVFFWSFRAEKHYKHMEMTFQFIYWKAPILQSCGHYSTKL